MLGVMVGFPLSIVLRYNIPLFLLFSPIGPIVSIVLAYCFEYVCTAASSQFLIKSCDELNYKCFHN